MGDHVLVNISGHRFCISRRSLRKYPHTRLAQLFLRETGGTGGSASKLVDNRKQKIGHEYFFDRNPAIFTGILDLYRSGAIHVPPGACWQLVQAELEFWQVDPARVCKSCQLLLVDQVNKQKELHEMQHAFGDDARRLADNIFTSTKNPSFELNSKKLPVKEQLAAFFRDPSSAKTKWTQAYKIVFTIAVIAYVFVYILESEPVFREESSANCSNSTQHSNFSNKTIQIPTSPPGVPPLLYLTRVRRSKGELLGEGLSVEDKVNNRFDKYFYSAPHPLMYTLDLVMLALFMFDFCLRFVLAPPPRVAFLKRKSTITDIVITVANTMATLMVWIPGVNFNCNRGMVIVYLVLEIFRVARLTRLLQFTNRYNGIRVLLLSLSGSTGELLLLLSGLLTAVLVFGLTIYVSEITEGGSDYDNFTSGFWWAIVTMATIGYGDYAPKSLVGMIVGAVCAVCGVMYVALQMPVIANRFNMLYIYAREQERRTETLQIAISEAGDEEPSKQQQLQDGRY